MIYAIVGGAVVVYLMAIVLAVSLCKIAAQSDALAQKCLATTKQDEVTR